MHQQIELSKAYNKVIIHLLHDLNSKKQHCAAACNVSITRWIVRNENTRWIIYEFKAQPRMICILYYRNVGFHPSSSLHSEAILSLKFDECCNVQI